ncbi:MAG: HAD family hydrolase [Lachnospiraceae bacterium]|nr:HAD family hydrolase [Lachnospiraceae bacterium]MDE7203630.1 HAD family hydrolase [Lachnospiraceae bacterium]
MFQYILFDLDGTLTDPKLGITSSVQYALRALGIEEPSLDKLEPFIGPPLADSFREFYGLDEERIVTAIAKYRERFNNQGIYENEIYPGIAEMLAALKASGKKLSIASSKPTEFVERILDYFAIRTYFDVIIGSNMDGTRSKKEEVVEEALRQMLPGGMTPAEKKAAVAMVGDRRFDIEGAKEHGITSVGVSFGYAPEGELEQAGADFIVDTVDALSEVLNG